MNAATKPRVMEDQAALRYFETEFDIRQAKGALDELFALTHYYRTSEAFEGMLAFCRSFKRYSLFNSLLIHVQMPGARFVLTSRAWFRDYGRVPKPEARPLVMLMPRGPVMFGFDVSQTRELNVPGTRRRREFHERALDPFGVRGRLDGNEFESLVAAVERDGVRVEFASLGNLRAGSVRNAASPYHCIGVGWVPGKGGAHYPDAADEARFAEITLNDGLSEESSFATLTHELGHLYCGHIGTRDTARWPARTGLDRSTAEFEAECVSYLVCGRLGIETCADKYLAGYLGESGGIPRISIERVFKAAQRIESMLQSGRTAERRRHGNTRRTQRG